MPDPAGRYPPDRCHAWRSSPAFHRASAGLAIATFEGNSGKVSLNRIALGLHGQGEKITSGNDDVFDEAGGIKEDAMIRMGARVSG